MKQKLLINLKRLFVLSTSLSLFSLIIFFIFIAPYRTLPILMYHSITNVGEKGNILTLSEDIFKRQMQYLAKHNYYVTSLRKVAQMIKEGEDISNNWVVLTFDDGYRDFYSQVYPILKERQFNATVFVIVNSLEKNKNSLNWEQVEQLAKDDLIDIGVHTLSHRMLPLLTPFEAKKEISLSKQILGMKLKEPIVTFCYPYGALDDSTKEMVKEAGFKVAVGTAYQRGQFRDNDIYILKRVFVSRVSKYPFVFRFMLSGYYVPTREFILRLLNIKVPRDFYAAKNLVRNPQIQK